MQRRTEHKVCAGNLRDALVYERKRSDEDVLGGSATQWLPVIDLVWAEVRPANSREVFLANQLKVSISDAVQCRFDALIVPEDARFVGQDGTIYSVTGVLDVNNRHRLMTVATVRERDKDDRPGGAGVPSGE